MRTQGIPDEQLFPAALLDSLIGNQDRHMGNYFYDRAALRVALFDHGFSLSPAGAFVNATYLLQERLERGASALRESEQATIAAADLSLVDALLPADRRAALHVRLEHMRATATLFDIDGQGDTTTDFTEGTT